MDTKELREMTAAELEQALDDTEKELFDLQTQKVTGQLEDLSQLRSLRRMIARIKTLQNEASKAGEQV